MGPTNRILSISPDVDNPAFRNITFDELREAYREQVRGLVDGGCDLLLLETIVDTLNAKAGIVAIEEVFEEKGVRLPLMISVDDHRSERPDAVGPDDRRLLGVRRARAAVQRGLQLRAGRARHAAVRRGAGARSPTATCSCYPNAGLPNAFGEYDEQPADTAGCLEEFADERLPQHRRRLLRHDARPHPGDRRRRRSGCLPARFTGTRRAGRTGSRSSRASRR